MSRCKACHIEVNKDRGHYGRTYHLEQKYRMTLEQWEALLESQGGRCAICGISKEALVGQFEVDHDHSCCPGLYTCGECVRGLICKSCNMGLGKFKDDQNLLESALRYLRGESN